jgi:hypothetical protein
LGEKVGELSLVIGGHDCMVAWLHGCMVAWMHGVMGECDGVDVGREVGKK